MRWHEVAPLREAPEYRALSRSRQEVLWFLWRRADSDGVVRKQICIRRMAERLNLPRETVRKCLQYLDRAGVITRQPGSGRARSLYVVPIAWDRPLTDPTADPPPPPGPDMTPSAGADITRSNTTSSVTRATAASATSTNGAPRPPEWIPRRPAVQQLALPGPRASADQLPDDEPDLWCERARAEGARHLNSRCCGTTKRQIEARKRAAAAARARAERERAAAEDRERRAAFLASEPSEVESSARAAARAAVQQAKRAAVTTTSKGAQQQP